MRNRRSKPLIFFLAERYAMAPNEPGEATRLLHAIQEGDARAKERLIELVYHELHDLAAKLLVHEDPSATLQPTVLVHEAYLRLDSGGVLAAAPNRHYFLTAAAQAMRQVLVDQARRRRTDKRGKGWKRVPLDAVLDYFERENLDVVALHEGLDELAALDERKSQVIVLRFFGGFTVSEVAEQLGVSVSTVESDFRLARAWLHQQISGGP
jgi:RNA polymerase sigma-70 factor (ECF subfamily)